MTYKTRQFIIISNTDWLCSGELFLLGSFSCGCSQKGAQVAVGLFSWHPPNLLLLHLFLSLFEISPLVSPAYVPDSGDNLTWCKQDLLKLYPKKVEAHLPFVASEAMQSHFHHIYWSGPSQNSQSSKGTWQTLLLMGRHFWNHHTLFKYRSKHTDTHTNTHTQFMFHLQVPWIFWYDSNMLLRLLLSANMHDLHRCLNGTLSEWNGNN